MRKLISCVFFVLPAMAMASPGSSPAGGAFAKHMANSRGDYDGKFIGHDNFSVIMGGDTQFARILKDESTREEESCGTDSSYKDCQDKAAKQIGDYFKSMALFIGDFNERNVRGVFINGDLTEYGHDSELNSFQSLLDTWRNAIDKKVPGMVHFYLGLGNHDYANNVHDCWAENCASRMFNLMLGMKGSTGYENMDVNKNGLLPAVFDGSMAYSTDIENVHFVQLNNYPTYTNSWSISNEFYYNVTSSLDWLEKDLAAARRDNKYIVICFHDPSEHFQLDDNARRFKSMLEKYKVSAVFVAHFHWMTGENPTVNKDIYGDVPVFQSGSSIYGEYTVVTFDISNKKMYLKVVGSYEGGAAVVDPFYPIKDSYDLK